MKDRMNFTHGVLREHGQSLVHLRTAEADYGWQQMFETRFGPMTRRFPEIKGKVPIGGAESTFVFWHHEGQGCSQQ